jgi:6-phosphogluconolactonase
VDEDPFVELAGVAVSPDGQSVYVVNFEAYTALPGTVLQYTVGADGTLNSKSPPTVPAGTDPFELAVSHDGRSVYVTHSQFSETTGEFHGHTVLQYAVGADGTLRPIAGLGGRRAFPAGIAVSGDGKNVYAANEDDDTVTQYSVGADGALSPKSPPSVPAGTSPYAIAVSPRVPTTKEQC